MVSFQLSKGVGWLLLASSIAVVVIAAYMVSFNLGRADASVCAGDSPAFSMNWRDNYWVGSDNDGSPVCDQAGQFIVNVQRINYAHNYRASSVDGYYGGNTQDDVEDFQGAHSQAEDGLVGTNTWGQYDNHPTLDVCYGTGECYWKYAAYSGSYQLWKQASSFNQICSRVVSGSTWVWFDRTGPNGTNSC